MEIETEIFCTLKMNEGETLWLIGIMQNSFCDPEEEFDGLMRKKFWDTLTSKVAPKRKQE